MLSSRCLCVSFGNKTGRQRRKKQYHKSYHQLFLQKQNTQPMRARGKDTLNNTADISPCVRWLPQKIQAIHNRKNTRHHVTQVTMCREALATVNAVTAHRKIITTAQQLAMRLRASAADRTARKLNGRCYLTDDERLLLPSPTEIMQLTKAYLQHTCARLPFSLRITSNTTEQSDMKHMDQNFEIQDIRSNRSFLKQTNSVIFYLYINDLEINSCIIILMLNMLFFMSCLRENI